MKNYHYLCTRIVEYGSEDSEIDMESLIDIRRPVTVCRASAGTGKTYTLAAYYVGLLLSGEDYRSILAITFTNKATAEMSERIIGYLHEIAEGGAKSAASGGAKDFLGYARKFMICDQGVPDEVLCKRAGECFEKMLLDYDNVQIQTIDSFLQTLLSGLAGVLKMSAGLSTELDIDHVIRTAVEQLLTTDMTASDRTIIEDYMRLKLDQESQWDVRESLCGMAKELYNESVQMLDEEGLIVFDGPSIVRRRKAIEEAWKTDKDLAALKEILAQCKPNAEGYNRYTKAAYERLVRSVEAPEKVPAKDRFRGVSEKYCCDELMGQATAIAEPLGRRYNTLSLTIRFSRDMELMSSLQHLIQRNLSEANCALLAKTAGTLSKALRDGDAEFILEKAGIRYHHVLMDEFQDTSRLQWSVIRRLLMDVLAGAGNTLLIVGDIKQSIYRWRNGDWHIMEGLTNDGLSRSQGELNDGLINGKFTSLTRNFRSSEEVVRFNLSLFDHIVKEWDSTLAAKIYGEGYEEGKLAEFYQAKKKGGYVRFHAIPNGKPADLAMEMFEQMEDLLARGVRAEEMMVLVREKKEAMRVTEMHADLDETQFPHLSNVKIVSADSFLLEASSDVQLVIAGLKSLTSGGVEERYIEMMTGRPELLKALKERLNADTPLYEAVSEAIAILLTDENGQYHGSQTAYLNALLDRTRAYVSAYGSNIKEFLKYWDDTMHAKPIPASSSNAIRILTVHASKGLQSQTLFVPFCTWTKEAGRHQPKIWCKADGEKDFVPIQDGTEMELSNYAPYREEEHLNMRIDNLNMLYVALTRAEDNLFVSTSYPVNKDGKKGACNHVGQYILDFVGGDDWEAGSVIVKTASLKVESRKTEEAELWADSGQVRFVQSQEGAMYTAYGDESYRRTAKMEEGTLCHDIFAHIRKADELDAVLRDFETRGLIASQEQREKLRGLISSAWKGNDEMRDWFTAPWELRLEEAIYIDQRELRPDRVMINPETKEAVVLDYKFGGWEKQYIHQVQEYMEALRRMGYSPVRGYLWFAKENRLVRV